MLSHPKRLALVVVALGVLPARFAHAFDEFGDDRAPTHFELRSEHVSLALKGEVELELHDLQGEGGPGYDSPTDTRTIGTRSPFVEIDAFWLALRLGLGTALAVDSELEFTMADARVGAVWFDLVLVGPSWLRHHAELGYHTPVVAIDRRTERYPLIGTSYWREPELHLAYDASFALAAEVTLEVCVSIAMMRPLEPIGVQDSRSQAGTINVLAYGAARPFSGNGPVGGGRVRLTAYGAFVEAFGFVGRLAAEGGTDALRSGFPNYRALPGYSADGADYGDFHWFGGRVGYDGYGVHAVAEAIGSREDLLVRWGAYGQLSYEIGIFETPVWLHTLEPVVRYEAYRIEDSAAPGPSGQALRSTAPINAVSWDWDALTLGLVAEVYRELLRVRVEYAFLWERNGVPALGIADETFRNDELLVQVELRF